MDINFFNTTLTYNWDMIPVDRSFDNTKVNEYLSNMDAPDRSFINDLIKETFYIKYENFKDLLFKSLEKFSQNIGIEEFYIILGPDKIGSEHWVLAILWPKIKELNLNVKQIISYNSDIPITGNIKILVIDDAIYSGNNTISHLDNFTYELSNKLQIDQKEFGKGVQYHIMIPLISKHGAIEILKFCSSLNIKCIFYSMNYIPILPELIDIGKYYPEEMVAKYLSEKYNEISDLFDNPLNDFLYKRLGFENINLPPIYFDHKVAGEMSTFSVIYLKGKIPDNGEYGSLFKVDPSRYKIEELATLFESYKSHQL